MKVNKDFIRLWAQKLRSGLFKQGKHNLRTISEEYCCLGVAACLMQELKLTDKTWEPELSETGCLKIYGSSSLLSPEMYSLIWYESGEYRQVELSHMNDDGSTFSEIADFLEEKYLS
jgi:hypothetical protein